MRSYQHLTIEERERIRVGIEKGIALRVIAAELGRSPSSISRELQRNSNQPNYCVRYSAYGAFSKYRHRRRKCHRPAQWGINYDFEVYLESKLKRYWPPEAIVGRYKKENPAQQVPSFQSIYYGIRNGLLPEEYKNYLRRKGRKRNAFRTPNNGKLSVDHVIQQRPEAANRRERLGDWESDSLIGKKGGACLATHVDRRSRYLVVTKLHEHTASEYFKKTIEVFDRYAKYKLHTMTVDRGMEFSCYKKLEEYFQEEGLTVYFADPNAPWQRGSNENTNGLIRQYIPKGMDITSLSAEKVQAIADELNNRPRKVLGWYTPAEIFFPLSVALD